jgi:hypothetical protein
LGGVGIAPQQRALGEQRFQFTCYKCSSFLRMTGKGHYRI